MKVSKNILCFLIRDYFDLKTLYNCQFVSTFARKCIPTEKIHKARHDKFIANFHYKQNNYFEIKRRENIIKYINKKFKNEKKSKKNLIKEKYLKQGGDCFCKFYPYSGSPNNVLVHMHTHGDFHARKCDDKCYKCGCVNPNEKESPHFKEGCPINKII